MEIGQAIEDEEPGKAQKFFRDPKNLATMLVLAAAASGPRSNGSSGLNHALRSGVGALAFRGSLDQNINQQRLREEEAASVQQQREAQAQIGQERNVVLGQQVAATEAGTQQRRDAVIANNQGADKRNQAQIKGRKEVAGMRLDDALRGGTGSGVSSEFSSKIMMGAYKGWADERASWVAMGRPAGQEPQLQTYISNALIAAMAAQGGFEFQPDVTTIPKPGGGTETQQEAKKTLPSPSVAVKAMSDPEVAARLGFAEGAEAQTPEVQERIASYQEEIRTALASGSLGQDELEAMLKDRKNRFLLPRDVLAEIKKQHRILSKQNKTLRVPTAEEQRNAIPRPLRPGLGPGTT